MAGMYDYYIANTHPEARLWEGCDQDYLEQITKHLSDASYHYADDSGREWGCARESMKAACKMANDAGLRFNALRLLHGHLSEEHERLRVLALDLLMSDEIDSIQGPKASRLFDLVGDINLDDPDFSKWLRHD